MSGVVRLDAPAKLTLSLRITGTRDDGYHLIDAEMVTVSLCDRIEIAPTSGTGRTSVTYRGAWAPDQGSADDLVSRALEAAGVAGVAVDVIKEIPAGAGLGGGSADAAALLRWAGVFDPQVAAALGADVPFCVVGGRARVRGIGEIVEPLATVAATYTLLTPPIHCASAAVYRRWDELGGPVDERRDGNDLTAAALDLCPGLQEARDRLADATGVQPQLAGSGSTWFVPGSYPGGDRRVVQTRP